MEIMPRKARGNFWKDKGQLTKDKFSIVPRKARGILQSSIVNRQS